MLDYIKAWMVRPKCPQCGCGAMTPVRRTPPYAVGQEYGGYKYICTKCGAVVDLPPHILMRMRGAFDDSVSHESAPPQAEIVSDDGQVTGVDH